MAANGWSLRGLYRTLETPGDNQKNYLAMAAALQEAGCAALAVHPRTRAQGYSGKADWGVIADLKRQTQLLRNDSHPTQSSSARGRKS